MLTYIGLSQPLGSPPYEQNLDHFEAHGSVPSGSTEPSLRAPIRYGNVMMAQIYLLLERYAKWDHNNTNDKI